MKKFALLTLSFIISISVFSQTDTIKNQEEILNQTNAEINTNQDLPDRMPKLTIEFENPILVFSQSDVMRHEKNESPKIGDSQ